jgi:hypothetical protein
MGDRNVSEKISFELSIKELSLKFTGSREVGQAIQQGFTQGFARMIDTQKTVMGAIGPARSNDHSADLTIENEAGNGQPANGHSPAEKTKTKVRRSTGGIPVKDQLRSMLGSGWFKEERGAGVIEDKLKTDGHNVSAGSLASRLKEMTVNKELYRNKVGKSYVYKDSPFDDSGRTAPVGSESAE